MNTLFRELAPVTTAAWHEIEKEAKRTLMEMLGARRVVDFIGPLGLATSAIGTGRMATISGAPNGTVEAHLRQSQPLVEIRVPFEMARTEIAAIDRGAKAPNLDSLIEAARKIAIAEDVAVFHGYSEAHIRGICEIDPGETLSLGDDCEAYPAIITRAVTRLRLAGIGGPYAVALGERCYTDLIETTKAGYPILEHIGRIVEGPIVWAPGLDGAVVISLRGGDFELVVGRDISIGYLDHDAKRVRLYFEESFTFRVLSPQAAVPLLHGTQTEQRSTK
ncbi:bacteriocin [Paramagnetospirillum marisnigri]|uniref:Bacteriocin n=1 Tax=Paramagnetospirillum marisnigri TaxID=1285242 RepID=A0A178MYR3_9PROT|nr:family 1 encapsulin nanocompartment shell protein [Paramagnetospirillum marisnigri]OAN55165.1 bacteriocin [Paramagnetospirillum marisnigri]